MAQNLETHRTLNVEVMHKLGNLGDLCNFVKLGALFLPVSDMHCP